MKFIYIRFLPAIIFSLFISLSTLSSQVSTDLDAGVKLGNSTTTESGVIRFDGSDFEGYDGMSWKSLTNGGGASPWEVDGSNIYYNSGNIGIGTSTPGSALVLEGTNDEFITVRVSGSSSDAVVALSNSDTIGDNLTLRKNGPTEPGSFPDGTVKAGSGHLLLNGGATKLIVGTTDLDPLHLMTDQMTRLFIDDAGYIGIGNMSPNEKIHLSVSGNDGLRIEGDGTGDARLWISNTAGGHFIFDDNSDGNALKIESANELSFNTNGPNKRMSINLAGEVAINSDPNANRRLNVFTDNDLYGIYIDHDGSSTAHGIFAGTESNGTSSKYGVSGSIVGSSGSGNAYGVRGFATTSVSNFWAMYCAGDFWYSGSLTAPSDERLKKDIKDLEPVLDRVLKIKTKRYEFNNEKYHYANLATGQQIGFIAQDIQIHFPELVEEENHVFELDNSSDEAPHEQELSILGLSSVEMIPILTKAIQEQQSIIANQQDQIDALIEQNERILELLSEEN